MPVSKKQLKANRRNAKRSTGPKTKQGKAVACRNAITHGLASSDIVINSPHLKEDPRQYDALLQSLIKELNPEGVLQQQLVIKIANCLWRYRRVINAETAQINTQLDKSFDTLQFLSRLGRYSDEDDDSETDLDELSLDADTVSTNTIPNGSFHLTLMHYEMRLDKQLARAYRLLNHLQLLAETKKLAMTKVLPTDHTGT